VAVVDIASFVIAAATVVALKLREERPTREEGEWRQEFMAGIRHIGSDLVLKHTLIAIAVALLVVGFMESAVFAAVDGFGKPASFVGIVISLQGVGAIAGGVSSTRVIRKVGEPKAIWISLLVFAAALAAAAASPWLAGFMAAIVLLGVALPILIVALMTLLQVRTPGALMGRVSAAADVLLGTPQAGSIALGALLVTLISWRSIFWIAAAVIGFSACYLANSLRGYRPPAEAVESVEPAETADTVITVTPGEPVLPDLLG
ncbi:MAG: MFS transporter, partial [Nocardioidaceae bacterium]